MDMDENRRDDRLDKVLEMQATQSEAIRGICRSLDVINKTLNGEGRPGMQERVTVLEVRLARVDFWGAVVLKFFGPVLMALLGFGVVAWLQTKL